MEELQEALEELKKMKDEMDKGKQNLNKEGKILSRELNELDLVNATPQNLEDLDQEIVRQKEEYEKKNEDLQNALQMMKVMKNHAQALQFQQKADQRALCKVKLRDISDDLDEIERLISEIEIVVEIA